MIAAALTWLALVSQAIAETSAREGWSYNVQANHRTRFEALSNQFRSGLGENDQLLSLTTSLRLDAERGSVFFVGELIDVRGYFDDLDGSVGSNDINAAELVQAYVGHKTAHSQTIAGRFTMDLGSRRLVGRNRFRTATNAFSGVRSSFTTGRGEEVNVFYTLPLVRLPDRPEAIRANEIAFDDQDFDLQFWGVHYARGWSERLLSEGFLFGLYEQDDPSERETRDRDIYTAGGRIFLKPAAGRWDIEIEGGHQWGRSRATARPDDVKTLDVSAQYLHAEVGYQFSGDTKTRVSVDIDYASGDSSPTDGQKNRFDALFGPIAGDLGLTSLHTLITRSNLISPAVRLETNLSRRSRASMAWRPAWLASGTDSFGSSAVRDPDGRSGRYAGQQIDGKVSFDLLPGRWVIEGGAAWFVNGEFFDDAPNATDHGDPLYGFLETRVSF